MLRGTVRAAPEGAQHWRQQVGCLQHWRLLRHVRVPMLVLVLVLVLVAIPVPVCVRACGARCMVHGARCIGA